MKQVLRFATVALLVLMPVAMRAQQIPAAELKDAAGKAVSTASLADGKSPFVLSMWMTTCKPCMKELEALTDEIADWDESYPLRIYAVSIDDSRSLQRAIALAAGAGWDGITPLFDPNGDLRRALNVSAVPQVFVYNKNGVLCYTHVGYRPGDEAQLIEEVRKAAAAK